MVTSFELTPICVVSPYQARRQEMKWGRGCKKVENGGAFVESGKWGVFCKKWTFPQRMVHYVQYQYFLFYIFLIWGGCVHTQRTPPAYGPGYVIANQT